MAPKSSTPWFGAGCELEACCWSVGVGEEYEEKGVEPNKSHRTSSRLEGFVDGCVGAAAAPP